MNAVYWIMIGALLLLIIWNAYDIHKLKKRADERDKKSYLTK